ncbi:MAG: hypothetical protein ACE5KK_03655 [Candidatus Brocadiales bacterium]
MLKAADCPVCQKELVISEEIEAVTKDCPACGKSVTFFTCPYCNSQFTSADIGDTLVCTTQEA